VVGDIFCNDLNKKMKDKTCHLVLPFLNLEAVSLSHVPADVLQIVHLTGGEGSVLFYCIMPKMAHFIMTLAVFYGQCLLMGPSGSLVK